MLLHRVAENILKIVYVKNENHTLAHNKCPVALLLLLLLQACGRRSLGRGWRRGR